MDIPNSSEMPSNEIFYEDPETGLQVRPITINDFNILSKWFTDSDVLESYGGLGKSLTQDQVHAKFFPPTPNHVQRCIIQLAGKPIGYIQIYALDDKEKVDYQYPTDKKIYATDQFIAEKTERGKGLGTALIRSSVQFITESYNPDCITLDPNVINERAIHVYEKCGFKVEFVRKNRINPKLTMTFFNKEFEQKSNR